MASIAILLYASNERKSLSLSRYKKSEQEESIAVSLYAGNKNNENSVYL